MSKPIKSKLSVAIVLLLAITWLGICAVADGGWGRAIFPFLYAHRHMDTLGHFVLIGLITGIVHWCIPTDRYRGFWMLTAMIAAVITLEEISQLWFPARNFSWTDLTADYLGLFTSAAVMLLVRTLRQGADALTSRCFMTGRLDPEMRQVLHRRIQLPRRKNRSSQSS